MPRPRPAQKMPKALTAALAAVPTATPPPVFELHIRPLIRSLDREHMDFAFNLWNYPEGPGADPIGQYTLILNRLKSTAPDVVMPPPNAGGPWPKEWVDLFERWLTAGAPRLGLSQVDPASLSAARQPGTSLVDLKVGITLPSSGHVAWIERRFADDQFFSPERPDEFVVYERQMTTASTPASAATIEDLLDVPAGTATVKIIGSNGTFTVTVT